MIGATFPTTTCAHFRKHLAFLSCYWYQGGQFTFLLLFRRFKILFHLAALSDLSECKSRFSNKVLQAYQRNKIIQHSQFNIQQYDTSVKIFVITMSFSWSRKVFFISFSLHVCSTQRNK